MKKVIIIGSGGHGAEIDDYIQYANRVENNTVFSIEGYLDDNPDNYSSYKFSGPLLGDIKTHQVRQDVEYLIGIANLEHRRPIVENFLSKNALFTSFFHPTAMISSSAKLGKGNIIAPMANIGPNVVIGDFNMINARASLGHDTYVGDYNFISPNVCFSGGTKVGHDNLFGINSATIPGITIGSKNKIMAGMIMDKNIDNDTTLFYRFKEKVFSYLKKSE